MYLLSRDYGTAVEYYSYLSAHFPQSKNAAAAHWRAGWLSYRQGLYADAARLFDEQIRLYPGRNRNGGRRFIGGRDFTRRRTTSRRRPRRITAPSFARTSTTFYAQMARQRLAALGTRSRRQSRIWIECKRCQRCRPPGGTLSRGQPAPGQGAAAGQRGVERIHCAGDCGRSRFVLVERAGRGADLRFVRRDVSRHAGAEAGFALCRVGVDPVDSAGLLANSFPEPWWDTIKAESAKNNLDPYLVASLIRQESEFNPSAISYANAYGLMQLLPSVGKAMAREEGMSHFQTFQLLDPETNIRLGTRYLRQMLDHFGGVQEYALAAYNAGDSGWWTGRRPALITGIDEFVESIPFTQTREYVEAILRNDETYRAIDAIAAHRAGESSADGSV